MNFTTAADIAARLDSLEPDEYAMGRVKARSLKAQKAFEEFKNKHFVSLEGLYVALMEDGDIEYQLRILEKVLSLQFTPTSEAILNIQALRKKIHDIITAMDEAMSASNIIISPAGGGESNGGVQSPSAHEGDEGIPTSNSQSRESKVHIYSRQYSSMDSRDNGLGVRSESEKEVLSSSKPNYIHHDAAFADSKTNCGLDYYKVSSTWDWSLVNCPECLKHRSKEAEK